MPSPVTKAGTWLFGQPHILLTITMSAWALNTILGRYVAGEVPPVMLSLARWGGAFAILLPFALRRVISDWPTIRRNGWLLIMMGLTGVACFNTMQYIGLQYSFAMNGLVIGSAAPLLIAFWSLVLFRDRLTWAQLAGLALSLAGVLSVISRGDPERLAALTLNRGDVWMVAASVIYAFYAATLRLRPPLDPFSFLAVIICIGAFIILPFAIWEASTGYVMRSTPLTWASFAFVATVPSLLAYICFNRGVELLGANRAGPFFHLVPAIGAVMAIGLLGEEPRPYHALGLGLIVVGIVLAQRERRTE